MDNLQRIIERTSSLIDLIAAVLFLGIVVRVYLHIDGLLRLLEVR